MNTKIFVLFLITLSSIVSIAIHLIYIQRLSNRMLQDYSDKLKQLEIYAHYTNHTFAKINEIIHRQFIRKNIIQIKQPIIISEILYQNTCSLQLKSLQLADIQMLEMYNALDFAKVGRTKNYRINKDIENLNKNTKDTSEEILKIFVIPHSHNDPGWLHPFETYHGKKTEHILKNMLNKLMENPRRKFIWAEISFFQLWWQEINNTQRNIVRNLIKNNQFEIVTGGWVMNDETNSHWISIVHQLTEGHQWLHKHLNYTPVSSWSIDAFGLSATQPVLLKKAGLKNMLIHRVHYLVKKKLAQNQDLEFRWRQAWDSYGETDMFTHVMLYDAYDISNTCGPDPRVCCQFDFKRLPGLGLRCIWRIQPQVITDANVGPRAELLLDQYRKKSQLFKTNVLLVPLGDDFGYSESIEWDLQYENYQKLFDYMNSHINLNVEIKFGTLTDYFNAVQAEKATSLFPTLSGDIFAYSASLDNYWSGYYIILPVYKRMDRTLLRYLRASEIILTLVHLTGKPGSKWFASKESDFHNMLQYARQVLALYQHHHAITGTSRKAIILNYGKKMMDAIWNCQNVLRKSTYLLLGGALLMDLDSPDLLYYDIDEVFESPQFSPRQYAITFEEKIRTKKIVLFNSLTFTRNEVVTFIVAKPTIEITRDSKRVKCQVSPIFETVNSPNWKDYLDEKLIDGKPRWKGSPYKLNVFLPVSTNFRVSFIANIPALSIATYQISIIEEKKKPPSETVLSEVKIYNYRFNITLPKHFEYTRLNYTEFSIGNKHLTALFNELGMLKAIKVGSKLYNVNLDFAKYGAREAINTNGAYLFLPDGLATPLDIRNSIIVTIEGPIFSRVFVNLPYVQHTVILYHTRGADSLGLEIHNQVVNIRNNNNFELVMRLSTDIKNNDVFFTDSNGYQVMKRRRLSKLPIQANYYPMPTLAYIEDDDVRLTVLTASPLGTSSLLSGQIEIMQDRRLMQDDNLDLGQGAMDNPATPNVFRFLLEPKSRSCKVTSEKHSSGFPTLSVHVASETLLNPLIRLLSTTEDSSPEHSYNIAVKNFGVDYTLPILRTGVVVNNKEYIGMVLHRQYLDICYANETLFKQFPLSNGSVNITALLPLSRNKLKLNKASLTFLHIDDDAMKAESDISLCPMETQAFLLHQ